MSAPPGDGRDAICGLPLRQVVLLERDPAGPKLGNRGVESSAGHEACMNSPVLLPTLFVT